MFGRSFGNTADDLAAEYGAYESTTDFGAVFDADGTAVGAMRLIRPRPDGSVKTLADAAGPPWNIPASVACEVARLHGQGPWDVATFGVDTETAAATGQRVVMGLCSVLIGALRDNGVSCFVAMLDTRARRAFSKLGVELQTVPGANPAPYLGSPGTVPIHQQLSELHADHAICFPELHQQVFHGRDIEGLDERFSAPGSYARFAAV